MTPTPQERTPAADPYATPPRYKNKSGAMIRVVILAGLLGAGILAYATMAPNRNESAFSAAPTEVAAPQQLADAAGVAQLAPAPLPEATPAPEPAATPAPARRTAPRPAPAPEPAPEPIPPPVTFTEPAPVTPIAPPADPAL